MLTGRTNYERMLTSAKCNVMTDNDDGQFQRLGDYLCERRKEAGFTAAEFCQKTRISSAVLKAMESGDYRALPAHAFARGFYTLYAKALGLNGERIVNWYGQERRQMTEADDENIGGSAIYAAPKTHRMASAAQVRPLLTLLILLVILALVAVTFCWHFEINPITVIREKNHVVQMRSQNRQRHFRIASTSQVIRRTDEKKRAPLVPLNGEH